jgi:hypothetical protein
MRSFSSRIALIASAAVLAVSGAAWAADAIQADPVGTVSVFAVADAATVTITVVDGALELLDVSTKAGWTASVDSQSPTGIEIDFLSAGRRLRFNAEIEGSRIRTRVEERTAPSPATLAETTTTTGAVPSGVPAAPGDETFDVLGAGTVTLRVDGQTLVLVDASAADGWTVSIDAQTAVEVEIDFRSGPNRIRFNGELEDGTIRPRVEVREGRAPDGTSAENTAGSRSTDGAQAFDIPGVGSVTVGTSTSGLTLLTVTPSGEWTVVVEKADGERVRVEFHRGESEVEFEARWDDGRIRFEVDQSLDA